MRETTRCHKCSALIFWAKTLKGKDMPIDAYPVSDGNIVLEGEGCDVLGPLVLACLPPGTERYCSHFATCPNADEFRRD